MEARGSCDLLEGTSVTLEQVSGATALWSRRKDQISSGGPASSGEPSFTGPVLA